MSTSLLILAALFAVGFVVWRCERMQRDALDTVRFANREMSELAAKATANLVILRGAQPHTADPATFAPSGVSWDALQKEREARKEAVLQSSEFIQYQQAIDTLRMRGQEAEANALAERLQTLKARV